MTAPASTYDRVVYDSKPRSATHPDNLATLGTLLGMSCAPANRCRVLEIGCATGGNLFPMAEALPDSTFLGIDPAPKQIDLARKVAGSLDLANLRFEALGAEDLDSCGQFDYILCHGVYSWVAPAVREGIMAACRRLLAPQGVAYISYNAKPGWHMRLPVREMMRYHVREIEDPLARVQQSRALLTFLSANPDNPDGAWAKLLREESEMALPQSDSYVLHEHLEEDNEAFYFHEFMAHAQRHDFQYLGEADFHINSDSLAPEVRKVLHQLSTDLLAMEQYLDFLRGRMFRRTLLVHKDVVLQRAPRPEILEKFHLSALARPQTEQADVFSSEVVVFRNEDGATVETNRPAMKAVLTTLFEEWPQSIPYVELWQRTRERLQVREIPAGAEVQTLLARSVVQMYLSGLVELHASATSFTTTPGERPLASPLTRLQAQTGAPVCNRRHRIIEIGGLDRAVLALLDGDRDRLVLIQVLVEKVLAGDLGLTKEGQPIADEATAREVLAAEIDGCIERLAKSAVLLA